MTDVDAILRSGECRDRRGRQLIHCASDDCADVLDESPPWVECWRVDDAARWLHKRGVRVMGGDDE